MNYKKGDKLYCAAAHLPEIVIFHEEFSDGSCGVLEEEENVISAEVDYCLLFTERSEKFLDTRLAEKLNRSKLNAEDLTRLIAKVCKEMKV